MPACPFGADAWMLSSVEPTMEPHILSPRYTVLEAIGQGAEGRVFRVLDSLRGSELALKLVPPELSQWLRLEFESLRQIQHENLIRVFDWGLMDPEGAFYTMELV